MVGERTRGRALAILVTACAVLVVALSIPLALGKVEPNRWYGIRLPASLESEAAWFEVNRTGGRVGVVTWLAYGLCSLWYVRRPPESVAGQLALMGSLVIFAVLESVLVLLLLRS